MPGNCGLRIADCGLKTRGPAIPRYESAIRNPQSAILPCHTAHDSAPALRLFEAADADFFWTCYPGRRDRDGMPEALAFWLRRVTECDPDRTFNVGLLYGPSGCGKSSLVKAGLLPRLPTT